jgi:hypothetical protein
VKVLPIIEVPLDEGGEVSEQESGPAYARKRAIDFM